LHCGQGFQQNQQLRAHAGELKTFICPKFCGLVGQDWDKDLSQNKLYQVLQKIDITDRPFQISAQPDPTRPVPPKLALCYGLTYTQYFAQTSSLHKKIKKCESWTE
jgi:hypothetical protein